MTPKFMRQEAARFRDMASMQEREASRLRLLGMADDYEARAFAVDGLKAEGPEPATAEEPAPAEASAPEPAVSSTRLKLGRRTTRSSAESV